MLLECLAAFVGSKKLKIPFGVLHNPTWHNVGLVIKMVRVVMTAALH